MTLDTLRYKSVPTCNSPDAPSSAGETCISAHSREESWKRFYVSNFANVSTGDPSSARQSNGHLYPDSPSPSPPYLHKPKHLLRNDKFMQSMDSPGARIPPPLASDHEKTGFTETQPIRKLQVPQNCVVASPHKKEPQNGRNQPWERFTPEAFAQHFHQAVLQSTHSTLQNKG